MLAHSQLDILRYKPYCYQHPRYSSATRLFAFFFFFAAPSSLLSIFASVWSSTPAGMLASSSSNTRWIIFRMSSSCSSLNREPAYKYCQRSLQQPSAVGLFRTSLTNK